MTEPEVRISTGVLGDSGDVEMQGGDSADVVEVGETGAADALGEDIEEDDAAGEAEKPAARVTFVEYVSKSLNPKRAPNQSPLTATLVAISNPPS